MRGKPLYFIIGLASLAGLSITMLFLAIASSPPTYIPPQAAQAAAYVPPPVQTPQPQAAQTFPVLGPANPRDYTPFSAADISCSSEYVMNRIKKQLSRVENPALAHWKGRNIIKVSIETDTIVTLGKTIRGVVCDADVEGFNSANERVAAEELYYRLEPSDNDKMLWVEYITRDQAMSAR